MTDVLRDARVRTEADVVLREVYWREIGVASGPLPGTVAARRIDADIKAILDAMFIAFRKHGLTWVWMAHGAHYPTFLAILLQVAPDDPRPWLGDTGIAAMVKAAAVVFARHYRDATQN